MSFHSAIPKDARTEGLQAEAAVGDPGSTSRRQQGLAPQSKLCR